MIEIVSHISEKDHDDDCFQDASTEAGTEFQKGRRRPPSIVIPGKDLKDDDF